MLVGVLSDTHDSLEITRRALELLTGLGCEALIHCGDLTTTPVIDMLAGTVPAHFVFGNNDFDRVELQRYAEDLGVGCLGTHGILELDGKRIAVAHGDVPQVLRSLVADDSLAYILTGHTHAAHDERRGTARWINPGALYRTRAPSVCTIDLARDAVKFHRL
jgi:putative phosphoesterase